MGSVELINRRIKMQLFFEQRFNIKLTSAETRELLGEMIGTCNLIQKGGADSDRYEIECSGRNIKCKDEPDYCPDCGGILILTTKEEMKERYHIPVRIWG